MLKNSIIYIKKKITKGSIPFHAAFYVTGRCLSNCRTCFYWHHLNKGQPELTLFEIDLLFSQLRGVFWIAVTGGEPFLRDDLGDILKIIHQKAKPTYMTLATSGFFPEKLEDVLCKVFSVESKMILTVSVSLDGIYELHDYIRGLPGSFEKVCETISLLLKLQSRFDRLRIRVCTCYNVFNQDRIDEIPSFLACHYGKDVPWDFSLIRGNPQDALSKTNINIKKYFSLKQKYRQAVSSGNKRIMLDRFILAKSRVMGRLQEQIFSQRKNNFRCRAALDSIVIREQGDVIACELKEYFLGNLKDYNFDFRKLYGSKQAVGIRRLINLEGCQCGHECNLAVNMLFSIPVLIKCLFRILREK